MIQLRIVKLQKTAYQIKFIIFQPHIIGEENHNLFCVVQFLRNLHDLHPLHLVTDNLVT